MKFLKRLFVVLLLMILVPGALVVHYFFPRTIEVYVVDTQNVMAGKIAQPSKDGKPVDAGDLDRMMIQTVDPADNRAPHVFRNEDAWWLAKFNSFDLQTIAADAARANPPRLVRVRYYGWRIAILSMLPNAISMRPVEPAAAAK